MKSSQNMQRLGGVLKSPHWSFLIALLWVALTSLAAGAALVLAVNATFFIVAVFAAANLSFMALLVFTGERRDARATTAITPSDPHADLPSAVAAERGLTFVALPAHARADELFRELFARQSFFPVTQGGDIVGMVSKGRVLSALAKGQGDRLIAELMNQTGSSQAVLPN